jgi:hypothetical protein
MAQRLGLKEVMLIQTNGKVDMTPAMRERMDRALRDGRQRLVRSARHVLARPPGQLLPPCYRKDRERAAPYGFSQSCAAKMTACE